MKQKPNDQQLAFQFAENASVTTKRRGNPRRGQNRACKTCGKIFYVQPWVVLKNNHGRFCSRKCCGISLRGNPSIKRNGQEYACETCGKMFYVQPCERKKGHGRFCSRSCGAISQRGKRPRKGQDYACETCGKTFYKSPSERQGGNGRFCSKSCFDVSQRGKPSPKRGKPSPLRKGQESSCEQCGKMIWVSPYARKRGYGRFCSKHCFGQSLITGKVLQCLECGGDMWAVPSVVERKKYCSRSCNAKAQDRLGIRPILIRTRACAFCKQDFTVERNSRKYCSIECRHAASRTCFFRQCKICNADMYVRPSVSKTHLYCSQKCAGIGKRGHKSGPQSRTKRKDGYISIYWPTHPSSNKRGTIFEHRVVAEEKYGRRLQFGEHVHHINGIKDDNRPENLEIVDIADHARITNQEGVVKRRKNKAELEAYRQKFGPLEE